MALTFTDTLSREMMSWGGTSWTMVCIETFTIASNGQKMSTRPGPFGLADSRPSQKVTARSYSLRMFTQRENRKMPMKMRKKTPPIPNGMGRTPSLDLSCSPAMRTHRQQEMIHGHDLDFFAGGHGLLRLGVPKLAMDEDLSPRRKLRTGHAGLLDQPFGPRSYRQPPGAQGHPDEEADDQEREGGQHGAQFEAHPQRRLRPVEQH